MMNDTGMVSAADGAITENPVAHMKAIATTSQFIIAGPRVKVSADLMASVVNP